MILPNTLFAQGVTSAMNMESAWFTGMVSILPSDVPINYIPGGKVIFVTANWSKKLL